MPTHGLLDAASEQAKGKAKIDLRLKELAQLTWIRLEETACV